MKVGTITFHRAMNSGAVLQAFALQNYLQGYCVAEIIDYRNDSIEYAYGYKQKPINRMKEIAKFFIRHEEVGPVIRRRKKFIQFGKKYLVTSKRMTRESISSINSQYDFFIAGSDQTFNPKITGGDMNYLLAFSDPEKRYSYGASFGGKNIDETYYESIRQELLKFQKLLVRETNGVKIANELGIDDNKVKVVCDPVFLIDKEQWIERFNLSNNSSDPYIFLYFAATQTNSIDFVKDLSTKLGIKVVYFNSFSSANIDDAFVNVNDAGPLEFLKLIFGASCVVTTSFHAIAFSLLFNIPFYYELGHKGDNDNSRLENLCNIVGTNDREIIGKEAFCSDMDWNLINNKIAEYVMQSKIELQNILFENPHK